MDPRRTFVTPMSKLVLQTPINSLKTFKNNIDGTIFTEKCSTAKSSEKQFRLSTCLSSKRMTESDVHIQKSFQFSRNPATLGIVDKRNMASKAVQNKLIGDIISFMQMNDCTLPITSKNLQTFSSRDFTKVFQYLYSFMDSSHKFGSNFEDEIPNIMKLLRYPFNLTKQDMFNYSSCSSYIFILCAMHWFTELIKMMKNFDHELVIVFSKDDDDINKLEILRWSLLLHVISCDQYNEKIFDEEIRRSIKSIVCKNGAPMDVEYMKKEIAAKEKEFNEIEEQYKFLETSRYNLETITDKNEKLQKHICDLKNHLKENQNKLCSNNQSISVNSESYNKLKLQLETIEVKLEEQIPLYIQFKELSEKKEIFDSKIKNLNKEINEIRTKRNEHMNTLIDLQFKLKTCRVNIENSLKFFDLSSFGLCLNQLFSEENTFSEAEENIQKRISSCWNEIDKVICGKNSLLFKESSLVDELLLKKRELENKAREVKKNFNSTKEECERIQKVIDEEKEKSILDPTIELKSQFNEYQKVSEEMHNHLIQQQNIKKESLIKHEKKMLELYDTKQQFHDLFRSNYKELEEKKNKYEKFLNEAKFVTDTYKFIEDIRFIING